jgi:hypothetical protein
MFLYDLNIREYLSTLQNKSVAHYTINMDVDYSNLKVNTVFGPAETLQPIEYTVTNEKPTVIRIDEVSEFNQSLPGDLLISFSEPAVNVLPIVAVILIVVAVVVVASVVFVVFKRRRSA